MVHDSEVGFEAKVPDVQPPSANWRFGDIHAFCLGVSRVESSDDKVYLARSDLLVGGLIELGGFWRPTPRVESGEPVAFEKSVQGIRIKSIRSGVKGGVACGPAHVWRSRFDFSLEVPRNDQGGTKRDTSNSTTQLAKKGVALITQDDRVDSEIVWKLVAIKDCNRWPAVSLWLGHRVYGWWGLWSSIGGAFGPQLVGLWTSVAGPW